MRSLNLFYEIANDPIAYVKKWRTEHCQKVIGLFCSYVPEEIIFAAGALPFRIFGTNGNICSADAHLQSYSCKFIRSALELKMSGQLDFIDGVIFPHTCDSIQRLSDIWRINLTSGFHIDIIYPVKLNTKSAMEYMENVLKKFRYDLEKNLNVSISDNSLKISAEKYNEIRSCLKKIYEIKCNNPSAISSSDMHAVTKASMVMDRDDLLTNLKDVIESISDKPFHSNSRKRIIVSGGLCTMPDIYGIIENFNAVVIWDDLCTGSRYFDGILEENIDTIKSISQRYLNRVICPAKHNGLFNRGEKLIQVIKEKNADGVIFLLMKFCDPHSFDYPYLKEMLGKETIPSMLFEVEDHTQSMEQFKTRFEAFLEMISQ